uniref:Uncharacterized protein n=2 Tax=Bionectria ochroleuca TaxID=29856 RepID=A0A0B7K7P1_BIOOC
MHDSISADPCLRRLHPRLGYTKAEAVNYADEQWAPSKLLWCDSSCTEYSIDVQDMDSDVVDARVPEASIDREGVADWADQYQLRNANRQDPAIETNLGRSLTPYGRKLVRAFMGNQLDLDSDNEFELGSDKELDRDSMRKARVLQMLLQCEWPSPGDITPLSADPAELFTSVACIKRVRRMTPGSELVVNSYLQLGEAHERALERLAATYRRSTGYFSRLIRQGVVLEQMADALGMHILVTLPVRTVMKTDFALAIDDGIQQSRVRETHPGVAVS